jgi:hypothetical protein
MLTRLAQQKQAQATLNQVGPQRRHALPSD